MKNVSRLISDVEILVNSNHFSSAHFLLTTAKEEMAKSYIFLDMCRLNFLKHKDVLKKLCRAFYDHISKYAYFQLHYFWRINNMSHAKEIWKDETTKWWPVDDITSGEPDMPNDIYFEREMPLYVDYREYDQRWSVPDDDEESFNFEKGIGADIITKAKEILDKIVFTSSAGLFNTECLKILNDEFQNKYISDKTGNSIIEKINERVAIRLYTEQKIELESFFKSIFRDWPLYHFLTIN
ncbi:AbiV family abortive infection protein [candidate division KSB1 bacterium]|nr:AbiV family abortive infection protein [candidate division KSB1 bacterium]